MTREKEYRLTLGISQLDLVKEESIFHLNPFSFVW